MSASPTSYALRGAYLQFTNNPFFHSEEESFHFETDGIIWMQDGLIHACGPSSTILHLLPADCVIQRIPSHQLILPGFVDAHVHYSQLQIIGAYGKQLLDWLNKYTFVAEQEFASYEHAKQVSAAFFDESLRHGITTSVSFATVHPPSVDAFFEEAQQRGLRALTGKVMMDVHTPDGLRDTAQLAYDESLTLIEKWHGKDRLSYVLSPRFALTSSPAQLEATASLWDRFPDVHLQSHVSENKQEIIRALELYPNCSSYLDIYDQYQLLRPKALYGHGVYLDDNELARAAETGTAVIHCPTSNFFLGSGYLDVNHAIQQQVRIGIGTDIGAGTSLSMLQTLNEAYKAAQLNGYPLSAIQAFWLATRGGAEALHLEHVIGSIQAGNEADLVVVDLEATPLMKFRNRYTQSLQEQLFCLMTLGDDRAIAETWAAGRCVWKRSQ